MTEKIIDLEARQKITQQLSRNFMVEAGAGSGKTTCLVDRIINLILTGKGKINEIAAITFTRKAADDLKMRFLSKLEEKAKDERDIDKKFRIEEAMKNIDHCFLGTVHSFCSRLLRERPIEVGLDVAFTELEEADDEQLISEAWQLYLSSLQENDLAQYKQLNEIGIPAQQLQSFLVKMKNDPDVDWIVHNIEKPALNVAYQELIALMEEARSNIPDSEPVNGYDKLQQTIVQVLKKAKHIDVKNDSKMMEIFEMCNKKLSVTLYKWPSKEIARHYEERLGTFITVTIAPLLQQWKEYCHPIIVEILKGGLKQYEELKKSRSLVNFQDLLLLTTKLLKKNPEVRQYFQQKYRFLLIDEYQDSDPIQAEMMFLLTSEDLQEEDWTKCTPRPGSLFVVGDPKQAIYRFRRADIDTYNRVKQLIEEHGGEVLRLTMNFRTIDGITKVLNTIFEEELPENETKYQAAYRPLHSYFESSGKGFEGIKVLNVPSDYSKKDEIVRKDAENIALCIQNLLFQGHKPKEFMVLTRYTEGVSDYAGALEHLGIPVNISGEIILGDNMEFKELNVLLHFFTNPSDQLALVAVLRGLFFGISDDNLLEWKRFGGIFSIYHDVDLSGVKEDTKRKIANSLEALRKHQKWIQTYSPTVAIEKIMEDVGLYALLLTKPQSKRLFKSLLQMIEALRKHESAGETTYSDVYACFTKMIHEKTTVANFDGGGNAVSVMNVHKSKGLEAEIVFLAHPFKKVDPGAFISKHIRREDHGSKGYTAFSYKKSFQTVDVGLPVSWETFQEEEYHYLAEEEKRILYVAVTRAEKALIISSSEKTNNNNPWGRLLKIEDLEFLRLPETTQASETKQAVAFSAEQFEEETSSMRFWLENSQESSYINWSPTEDKDYSEIIDLQREEGGGMQWGILIHDVMEKFVQGEDIDEYISKALTKYNISLSKAEEVYKYIQTAKASFFWKELQIADEVYTEVPFNIVVDEQNPLRSFIENDDKGERFFVKGIIDLVYRIKDEWNIIDYKTDRLLNWQEEEKLQAFYKNQLSFYQEVWKQIVNSEKVRAELFFFEKEKNIRV